MTPTEAIVLGLLEQLGEASAYEVKGAAAEALGNFWTTPHSQVYRAAEQLAANGMIMGRSESTAGGRTRTAYRLTRAGRSALAAWRREPDADLPELRDPALLKLHFGADAAKLARVRLAAHREQLASYEELQAHDLGEEPRGPWLTLRAGIAHERVWIEFWQAMIDESEGGDRGAR